MSGTLPTVFTASGLQPQTPASLNSQLIAQATTLAPAGLSVLPGGLIEDLASTCTGALVVIDQARVDLVASVTPLTANPYLLNQLGTIYGVTQGTDTNTGVYLVFSGPAGYVVPGGFTVSDGTYQYTVQDAGIISTGGASLSISAVATQAGSWAVPANTVTQIITSVPSAIKLSVTNPLPGTPGGAAQTEEDYRSEVLQAGLAASQGMTTLLKTYLNNVPGVLSNLISVRQQITGGWEIIVGGSGDPHQIGFAIFQSLFDISTLVGSVLAVSGITNASPAVVTTAINHGFSNNQIIVINGALGISGINGVSLPVTVISLTSFSVAVNTTSSGTYTGGGVVSPNFRNVTTNIYDYPDTYTVPFVVPPLQTVSMVVTWNTSSSGFVSAAAVAGAASGALAAYVNALPVGQAMNLFELQATFQTAVSGLIPLALLTRMVFAVSIDGVGVSPEIGTGILAGDPESYFSTTSAAVVVNQG